MHERHCTQESHINFPPSKKFKESSEDRNTARYHWSNALKKYVDFPERFPQQVVEHTTEFTLIKDCYPKSKVHLLLMPAIEINSVWELKSDHLEMLENFALKVGQLKNKFKDHSLQAGFHAVPSMAHLHLHIVSNDFISPCLKNKRHYLSFTTQFFLQLQTVIDSIKQNDVFVHALSQSDFEKLLKGPLKCHVCRNIIPNIPKLRAHLLSHQISPT